MEQELHFAVLPGCRRTSEPTLGYCTGRREGRALPGDGGWMAGREVGARNGKVCPGLHSELRWSRRIGRSPFLSCMIPLHLSTHAVAGAAAPLMAFKPQTQTWEPLSPVSLQSVTKISRLSWLFQTIKKLSKSSSPLPCCLRPGAWLNNDGDGMKYLRRVSIAMKLGGGRAALGLRSIPA